MIHFLKLIRWPNLVMMLLIMILVRLKIIAPAFEQIGLEGPSNLLSFLVLLLIILLTAAGGYIVNDLIDEKVDQINKSDKLIIGRHLTMKQGWWAYRICVGGGLLATSWLGWFYGNIQFALLFFFVITGLLWFYSQRYQCIPLLGNVIIAFLSSMVIPVVWIVDFFILKNNPQAFANAIGIMPSITGYILAYALFAFLTSLIREIVKDIEDKEGDAQQNCKTLPIALGTEIAKSIAIVLMIILLVMIGFWYYILIQREMTVAAVAMIPAAVFTIMAIVRVALAAEKRHFSQTSTLLKIIMLAGIATMLFLS